MPVEVPWEVIICYSLFGVFVFEQQRYSKQSLEHGPDLALRPIPHQIFQFTLSISAFLGMLCTYTFLFYYGYKIVWWAPLLLYPISLIISQVYGIVVSFKFGSFLLTLISFFGWPVCAFFMFSMIKNVRLEQATDLMHTGKTFFQNGEYTKSQDYFSRSLNIINEDFDGTSIEKANCKLEIGKSLYKNGKPKEAIIHLQQALHDYQEIDKQEDIANAMVLLGNAQFKVGIIENAKNNFNSAIEIINTQKNKPKDILANVYSSLGVYHMENGNNKKALELFDKAIDAIKGSETLDEAIIANIHNFMGNAFMASNLHQSAKECYEKSLSLASNNNEIRNSLGGIIYLNLASVNTELNDMDRAYGMLLKSKSFYENKFGDKNSRTAAVYKKFADYHHKKGELSIAVKNFQKAINIYENSIDQKSGINIADCFTGIANVLNDVGEHSKALKFYYKSKDAYISTLGEKNYRLLGCFENIALSHFFNGEIPAAISVLRKKYEIFMDEMLSKLPEMNQEERFHYINQISKFSLICTIGDPLLIAEHSIKFKGISGEVPYYKDSETYSPEVKKTSYFELLRKNFKLDYLEVMKNITEDTIVIDFLKYDHLGKSKFWDYEPHYGAVIYSSSGLKRDGIFLPTWVPLGPSSKIDLSISKLRKGLNLTQLTQELGNKIFKPLLPFFSAETKKIIVCTDGNLNFLPFPALLDEKGSFLAERYDFFNVAAIRDLISTKKLKNNRKEVFIFADPDFDIVTESEFVQNSTFPLDDSLRNGLILDEIPGTRYEAHEIGNLATRNKLRPSFFIGPKASESELRKVQSPLVLHIATHGFFRDLITKTRNTKGTLIRNFVSRDILRFNSKPMQRSGIALSGALNTINGTKKVITFDSNNDGILTAEEALNLNLKDTWLTVLSACDTGIGESTTGAGVLGLRRAFAMAGTQNLLLTLWPVSDSFTKDFMVSFYEEALETGNAPKALAKVQKEWLIKLREERNISQAVKLAGPFVLTFRGNPELN